MGKELLLEIGTEEIPAAFLPKALADLETIARAQLAENRIGHGEVRTMATPRRLLLAVAEVAERQEDQLIERLGPAARLAFDEQGNPSRAAVGFARGQNLEVSELVRVTTDKGEYLCARRQVAGEQSRAILPGILTAITNALSFRKSMRWSDQEFRFARPVHWILALYDGQVVPFTIANIQSADLSRGHRFVAPAPFPVTDLAGYLNETRERFVIADPDERRRIIRDEAAKAAAAVGGFVLPSEELLETVTFLTEYPTAVCGNFDPEFLALPREVLITTMISHQKYFPVTDGDGALLPHFITISNTPARDPSVVRRGNEKVIRARLSDARFFFESDRKVPLESRVEGLRKVVFHTLLGTSHDKVARFRRLSGWLAERLDPSLAARVDRVALLSKADLETQMVGEFAELQGIMGREYALLSGEEPVVARAIHEHYLPIAAGGELPATDEGAIVSIADKTDSICGFFGVGLVPTGTADPYALRRQALGIIAIILAKRCRLSLEALVAESLAILEPRLKRPASDTALAVLEFLRGRFESRLIAQGHPYDVVDAILATGIDDLVAADDKIRAMAEFKSDPDFEPLAIAFKRVVNIVRGFQGGPVDPALFAGPEERNLHAAIRQIRGTVAAHLAGGDYPAVFRELASLRAPVDAFFGAVLVMAEDERLRANRLSLLFEIASLFRGVADFSRIVTESA